MNFETLRGLLGQCIVGLPDNTSVEVLLFDLDEMSDADLNDATDEERQRAARYKRPHDGRHLLARRVLLRCLLAERSGQTPEAIKLIASTHGRPVVESIMPMTFNTSRSGRYFAVALGHMRNCGIDIEQPRRVRDVESLTRRIISDADYDSLLATGPIDQTTFLRLWTRKEAVLKALGVGLSVDPALACVPLARERLTRPQVAHVAMKSGLVDVPISDLDTASLGASELLLSVALAPQA